MTTGRSALALAAAALFAFSPTALAGNGPPPTFGEGALNLIQRDKLFDRPDLLNFDPFRATDTWEGATESLTFSSMGQGYSTTVAYYTDYGLDCFNDPDPEPDAFLPDNFLCVRAGHRRPNAHVYDLYYAFSGIYSYAEYSRLSYLRYVGQGVTSALIDGLFGSEVYISGYFRVETKEGGEVFAEYLADIPDRLTRKIGKIVLRQHAFIDFGALIESPEGEPLSAFASWFETCQFKANVNGVAAASVGPMSPPNKQGLLQVVRSRLECDRDAVQAMVGKVADGAFEASDGDIAAAIFLQALTQLGDSERIDLKVRGKDGTGIIDRDDDDDIQF